MYWTWNKPTEPGPYWVNHGCVETTASQSLVVLSLDDKDQLVDHDGDMIETYNISCKWFNLTQLNDLPTYNSPR